MLAWLAYATVSVVWGSTFLAIAWAIDSFTPFGLSAVRFIPAALIALAIGRLRREPWPAWREVPRLASVGVLLLTVCMALIAWAEARVASGVTAVMAGVIPLLLALMARQSLAMRGWLGLALGFLGVALLMWPSAGSPDFAGCAALALSTVIWSWATLLGGKKASSAGHFTQVGIEMASAGALSLVIANATGGTTHAPVSHAALLALGYLIVFGSIAAYSAYIYLTKTWPAARVGTYAFCNPVVAVALGCGLRGEPFRPAMGAALALILAGVALLQVPRVEASTPKRQSPVRPFPQEEY
ncbi:EamA family transporter [Trinickia fusca]|nr:EamA family transporter [Trinickia fusca]